MAWKQVISTIKYYVRSVDFKSGITKAMTMQIVEVAFRDLTQERILLNDNSCEFVLGHVLKACRER